MYFSNIYNFIGIHFKLITSLYFLHLMKLKGQYVKAQHHQYYLKDQLTQGGFSIIYTTNIPTTICKVQVISVPNIAQAYRKEKEILLKLKHKNIVQVYDYAQITTPNHEKLGLLFMQNCNCGTALNKLQSIDGSLAEKDVITIFKSVAHALQVLHKKGIAHRDVKLENMLQNEKKQWKLCDFGSCTTQIISKIDKTNRQQIQQFIEKTTTPLYRSPQQLDLYSGFEIGLKVDIFAMGCFAFMLCFKQQPFETRLSAINKQYFVPQQCVYSKQLLQIIQFCFTTDPKKRPSATQVLQMLEHLSKRKKALIELNFQKQLEMTLIEMSKISSKSMKQKQNSTVSAGFFDKLKLMYQQFTTQTEGWISGFIEDSQQAPNLKYNRSIISKCWQKRYKVQKVYQIIWNFYSQNQTKSLVTLKLLILLHNFLRKGPPQAVQYDKQYCPIKLATKLYKYWKTNEKVATPDDPKRNVFVCLLIRHYCLLIISKAKFNYEHSEYFEGNFSILPFLNKSKQFTILKISIIQSMINHLQVCINFHEIVQEKSYLIDIQRSIILSIVDEQYCLLSTLIFVYVAFKQAISYVDEDLDIQKLADKLISIDIKLQQLLKKLLKLLQITQKFSALFQNNTFIVNPDIIDYIKGIPIQNKRIGKFNINDHLNYQKNICGMKIPLTYQQAIKNPNFLKDINKQQNTQYIDVKEYKKSQAHYKSTASSQNQTKKKVDSVQSFQELDLAKYPAEHSPKKQDINMQFTHQNFNRDFMTVDVGKKKNPNDDFNDFMSILEDKMEAQKKAKKKAQQNNVQNFDLINASVQVHTSQNPKETQVKNLQLINFFDDEQQQVNKNEKIITESNIMSPSQILNKTQIIPKVNSPQVSQKQIKSDREISSGNFVDLKGFILEEVRKNADQYFIDFKNLKLYEKVGGGHSSQVFRGQWRGREVAIKKIKDIQRTPTAQKQFKRQIMTSVKIRNHPQLVTLIGVAQHNKEYYIINQYCYGLTLFDLLHESNVELSWKIRISIARQIARGIVFLHTNQPPIIHRDLKSLNVLLGEKYQEGAADIHIKIADFGLSRDYASNYMTGTLGTYHWMAPQIFNNEPYSLKADVYSYGIMLWEIASRRPPYQNMVNPQALMKFVTIQNGRPDLTLIDTKCPLQIRMLMVRCWDRFPSNRPNFEEILKVLNSLSY